MRGLNLEKKNFLVTGVNSGLGKETARVLSLCNAHVYGTAKTMQLARDACGEIGAERATPMQCELTNPDSIRECIAMLKKKDIKLDGIIANA